MPLIKYPKFAQIGCHPDVPVCPSTTAVTFETAFDDIPVVVTNLSSTCGWAGATNVTTAGFNIWAQNAGTAQWIAMYSCLACTGNDIRADYYPCV